jgi:hypothetical protein
VIRFNQAMLLRIGNFDRAFVLLNGMAVTLALVFFAMAYLFFL